MDNLRHHLHGGIHRVAARLDRLVELADEAVDAQPIVALETALGVLRLFGRLLRAAPAPPSRTDANAARPEAWTEAPPEALDWN